MSVKGNRNISPNSPCDNWEEKKLFKRALSGIMLTILFTSMLALTLVIRPVKAAVLIYINPDGSIDPPTAPIERNGDVYTFTGNIVGSSIEVHKSNIVIDGDGYMLDGAIGQVGLHIFLEENVTIKNLNIKRFIWPIWLDLSSFNTIYRNNITGGSVGIDVQDSFFNAFLENTITSAWEPFFIRGSSGNVFSRNNIILGDDFGYGFQLVSSSNNILSENTITNGRIATWLESSTKNNISKNTITNTTLYAILLHSSSNNTVSGNTIFNTNTYSVGLTSSSFNNISRNTMINNQGSGIPLLKSSFNSLFGNNITKSRDAAIDLSESSSNNVTGNTIGVAKDGILMQGRNATNNLASQNSISKCSTGVNLWWYPENNTISGNNITDNLYAGISITQSSNNRICGNNFLCNILQAHSEGSSNLWDNGYPSGGNYWGDYYDVDFQSGPYQNETGSDGIGDVPYAISENNKDMYPFMALYAPAKPQPWASHDLGIIGIDTLTTVVGQGFCLCIRATIFNYGDYVETFNLTAYANATLIETTEITLADRRPTTVTILWNTTGWSKGTYGLSVNATPVLGEMDTSDNELAIGWITIASQGDITGPIPGVPDTKVDIRDIATTAKAFGSSPCYPNWNPRADVTGPKIGVPDHKVDIRDIAIVAKRFGQLDP